jgi:hypothetical protein
VAPKSKWKFNPTWRGPTVTMRPSGWISTARPSPSPGVETRPPIPNVGSSPDGVSTRVQCTATLLTSAVTAPVPPTTVQTSSGLVGWVCTRTSYVEPSGNVPENVKGPLAVTGSVVPRLTSTRPLPSSPSTVPPTVNAGGGGGGGWSSSRIVTVAMRRAPRFALLASRFAQRGLPSETVKDSGDSGAASGSIGISTSRDEVSPFSNRTRVRVRLKSRPERAEPPLVLTVTLVAPRDPPARVTSTIGVPSASPAANARRLSCSVPACGRALLGSAPGAAGGPAAPRGSARDVP